MTRSDDGLVARPLSKANLRAGSARPEILVIGAGFEERAQALALAIGFEGSRGVVAIHFEPTLEGNRDMEVLIEQLASKNPKTRVVPVICDPRRIQSFHSAFDRALEELDARDASSIWVDISGLPMHVIWSVLAACRRRNLLGEIRVIYTEAREYFPTRREYDNWRRKFSESARLPRSLTSEMEGNLIPEMFAGFPLRDSPTCLILQAGFEPHRSQGVVDQLNPNKLLLVYGRPERETLAWRVNMARDLHRPLTTSRPTSEEEVSTLDVGATVRLLTLYYDMLFDNHNIAVAPIGGKLQTVGAFLVWETFRDLQLVYPVPIEYLSHRFSRGIGQTFGLSLPALPGTQLLAGRAGLARQPRSPAVER